MYDEGKKTEVLARAERLRELLEEDADGACLERAFGEIRRSLDGLTREGQVDTDDPGEAAVGEAPPVL